MLIKITNLKVKTILGVYSIERDIPRDIIINLLLTISDEKSCKTDDILHTVNYDKIASEIHNNISKTKYFLIERVGEEIRGILKNYPLIRKAVIEIIKPAAIKVADSVAVVVEYER